MLCPFSVGFSYVGRGGQVQKFRRTRYGLAMTSAALVALGLTTGMSPYKSVDVVVDGKAQKTGTYASESVNAFLHQKGLHVKGYDLVEPARATLLQGGMKIVVRLAKAVTVKSGSQQKVLVHSLAGTVGQLLHSMRIRLQKEDAVNVPLTSALRSGMAVTITRKQTELLSQNVPIGYATVRESSDQFQAGVDVIARAGQNGLAREVTRKLYVNGKLVATRETRTVIKQPVDELMDVGTAQPPPVVASRSASSLVANEVLTVVATAYSNPGGYTATGAAAGYGDVAVDPSVIPLGTKLYIPGYGYGIANDTGGAIQGYRIDLCFNSVAQAWDFGRQMVKVYIVGHN